MRLRKIEVPPSYVHGSVQEWSFRPTERSPRRRERPPAPVRLPTPQQ